jgi:pantoate--beta-alanine ligase
LCAAKEAFDRGERDGDRLRAIMRAIIEAEPLAKLDYVSAADAVTLQETTAIDEAHGLLLSMAVRVGKPRLIDNFLYENGKWLVGEIVNPKSEI